MRLPSARGFFIFMPKSITGVQGSAINIRRSRKLFPVGPVRIASPSLAKKVCASLRRSASPRSSPAARARASVSPSATAPAAGLLPSIPSVPALKTATFAPAIFSTQASTNAAFRPPVPFPVTGELTSPSAITATRRPGCAPRKSSSCRSKFSAAFSTGQSSVVLSHAVMQPSASAARCAG
jgi:hypothetical protein